jgi:hypothetical protein
MAEKESATGIPNEVALKLENERLREQIDGLTKQLSETNEFLAKDHAEKVERVKGEILKISDFKPQDLEKMNLDQLNLARESILLSGTPRAAGIRKTSDIRQPGTPGRTVGAWDAIKREWSG